MIANVLARVCSLVLVLSLCGCGVEAPSAGAPSSEPAPRSGSAPPRGGPAPPSDPVPPAGPRGPREPGASEPPATAFDTVLVVLGNEPLDDETPTVDTVARVAKAVDYHREHLSSLLVFTGGPTAGNTSEARMMADLAVAQGVPETSIRLEERARSTGQNASLTAGLIREVNPRRVLIVSKAEHLEWAMPRFQRVQEFRNAEPLPSKVDRADSIAQMEEYLKEHDSPRVRDRLRKLELGIRGVD